MKGFHFNLSALLYVREQAEKAAYRTLMKAHVHLKLMLKGIEEAEKEYILLSEGIEKKKNDKHFADELLEEHDYIIKLEQKIKIQIEEVVKAQIDVEDKRLLVVQAMQQKKMIENLKEKHYQVWEDAWPTKESAFFDEVSSMTAVRKTIR